MPPTSLPGQTFSYQPPESYDPSYQHPAGDLAWSRDVSPDNLVDALGQLSIDHTGVGKKHLCLLQH